MRVSEIFQSIQGEGRFAGTESVFVRTTGCNLRCWYCDTPYSSWNPEGTQRAWKDVVDEVARFACPHVVVTGGEPILQPDVVPLTRQLCDEGFIVTIETAGSCFRPVAADLLSLSPKMSNSRPQHRYWSERHERQRYNPEAIREWTRRYEYQLKFVIDEPGDLWEVREFVQAFDLPADRIWLMPQAQTEDVLREKTLWLEPECQRQGFRFSPRLHIELFGNVRGK